jgi:hypothetical protein
MHRSKPWSGVDHKLTKQAVCRSKCQQRLLCARGIFCQGAQIQGTLSVLLAHMSDCCCCCCCWWCCRPEFVNRVDEFIVFEPLIRSQIRDIVGLRASALVDRVATQHITMKLGDSALEFLAAKVSAGSQGSQRSVLRPQRRGRSWGVEVLVWGRSLVLVWFCFAPVRPHTTPLTMA